MRRHFCIGVQDRFAQFCSKILKSSSQTTRGGWRGIASWNGFGFGQDTQGELKVVENGEGRAGEVYWSVANMLMKYAHVTLWARYCGRPCAAVRAMAGGPGKCTVAIKYLNLWKSVHELCATMWFNECHEKEDEVLMLMMMMVVDDIISMRSLKSDVIIVIMNNIWLK